MADAATESHIRKWLNKMARLTAAGSDPVSVEKIADYAELLARDHLPTGAFTTDSLHAALAGQTFFPAYNEIKVAVTGWWDGHRPGTAPRLAAADARGLSPADATWLAFYRRRKAEIETAPDHRHIPDRKADFHAFACSDLGRLESLVRGQSPAAWAAVNERPPPAEPDPRSMGRKPEEDLAALPDAYKAIARTAAQALDAAALDARLRGWSADRQLAALAVPEVPTPIRPSHASSEQLEAMRKASAEAIATRVAQAAQPPLAVPVPAPAVVLPWH